MSVADKLTTIAENEQKVYDAGKKAAYDWFWDRFQGNINTVNNGYMNAFSGVGWTDETFNPKIKNMTVKGSAYMMFASTGITDVTKNGTINIDFSEATTTQYTFYSNKILKKVGVVASKYKFPMTFQYAESVETIELIKILPYARPATPTFVNAFNNCKSLKNITIEGEIRGDVSFQWSTLLTLESAKSILTALIDYSGTANTGKYKVTLSDDTWALVDADGATSPTGTTWRDYVLQKGWLI